MHLAVKTYHFGASPLHRADPRVKIALLLAYSITLFLLETWTGLAIAAVLYALAHAISRVPFRSVFMLAAPTYVLVAVAIAFCSFTWDVSLPIYLSDAEVSMAAPFAAFDPIALAGSRCARFSGSGVVETLRAWGRVFVSLFVALFRRADRLAAAMDARCYGAPTKDGRRSALEESHLGIRGAAAIVVGIAACVLLALFF